MPVFRELSPRRGFAPRNAADAGALPAIANSTLGSKAVLFMASIIQDSTADFI